MSKQDNIEEFMCEDCGHTTAVPNAICLECGGKMKSFSEAMEEAEAEEIDDTVEDKHINEDGGESLEALKEEEEKDSLDDYHNDSFGDDE